MIRYPFNYYEKPPMTIPERKSKNDTWMGWHRIEDADGSPYMLRIWVGRLRLHVFHRGDHDPDCHDHPWDFWTFPLTPYVEEVLDLEIGEEPRRRRQLVRAFRLSHRPATHCHRVLGRYADTSEYDPEWPAWKPGPIVTLVWRSKPKRDWGFLKNRDGEWCWVAWKDYVFGGGKEGPCQ